MMGHRHRRNAAEHDAFSIRWRKFLRWHEGTRAWVKAKFNRKVRHQARAALKGKSDE